MIRKFILTILFIIISTNIVNAKIDVVYPTSKELTVTSSSVYFSGNTDYGSEFYINNQKVNLWNNNFFVHVVPLNFGENKIKLTSVKNGKKEDLIYTINRNKYVKRQPSVPLFEPKNQVDVIYTKVIKPNATVREKPTKFSNRVVDLPLNVILYLEGKKGEYYKIEEIGPTEYWIHESNIKEPVKISNKIKAKFLNQKFYSDDKYEYCKIYLSHPVLFQTKQNENTIELTLFGVETKDKEGNVLPNYKYKFEFNDSVIAYDCYYEDNNFIFRKAKLPMDFDVNYPLKDIKIFVDAGHGGCEKGAVGPTRVNEKDINLSIANYLVQYLKSAGADVITSRTDDCKVGLYDRVDIAKQNDALISISIHNNSLALGGNPYLNSGTEVHYYNENAKSLAEIINKNLALDLNLKDNGIHKSSFVMTRQTLPVSLLVEVAYMINPEEYILLQNSQFQKNVAKSIKKSIEKYIIMIKK